MANPRPTCKGGRGERNSNAKLTEASVIRIRKARLAGALYRDLAEAYGMSWNGIRAVCRRKSWTHI